MTKTKLKKRNRRNNIMDHQIRTFKAMLSGRRVQLRVEFLFGGRKEWVNVTNGVAASYLAEPVSAKRVRIKPEDGK